MTARILHGKPVADAILSEVAGRAAVLARRDVSPRVVFVTMGSVDDAQLYVGRLERIGAKCGVLAGREALDGDVTREQFDELITRLNTDATVDGIIVQMPLPLQLATADLAADIAPRKDVDGISFENAGRLYLGLPGSVASTAIAMLEILLHSGYDPRGQHAVVIGRSPVVGHPVAELMLHRNATVTITHRQTRDLAAITRQADILLVGAGRVNMITADMVRPGALIIDAGINVTEQGIVGDVDFGPCAEVAGAITPVPGGVGPVNNAVLLRNVVESAERRFQ